MGTHRKTFTMALHNIKRERQFQDFTDFIMEKLDMRREGEITDDMRRMAYRVFREKTQKEDFATLPTIRKWFGIGGHAAPDREQIYRICLSMGLSMEDCQEYLVYGIHEPAFQVNDYREVILVYGLENHENYEQCQNMIQDFEERLSHVMTFEQTCGTQTLMGEFQGRKNQPWEEFRAWMMENAASFKGYSKTTLDYFRKYKKLILQYAKRDAQEELERLLSETDYAVWCQRRLLNPQNYPKNVRKYVNAHSKGQKRNMSDGLKASIIELCSLAYTEKESNARLLSEVFQIERQGDEEAPGFVSVHSMTEKHLSDLLNVPLHKERFFRTRQAELEVSGLPEDAPCPEWILQLQQEYGKGSLAQNTAGEAKAWLARYRRENKRRCLQIQREDILPLILYVSQHRYLDTIGQDMSAYKQKDALEMFQVLADSTLAACNMSRLDPDYELDAVLCACYQQEEMFGYAELLELSH